MPITGQKPSAWSAATKAAVQTALDDASHRTVTDAEKITWNAKQAALLVTAFQITPDNTHYPSEKLVADSLGDKQDTLVSNGNIKTVGGITLLGAGDIAVDNINWRGAYNPLTADYIINDGVSYLGSSYICIDAPAAGVLPTDTDYWDLLAQMGNPGLSGVSGALTTPFTGQTSVTVTHNFGAYPAVQVLDNNNKVIYPLEITHSSVNAFVVTFAVSTSGNIISTIGGVSTSVITKGTDYTLLPEDNLCLVNAACTITLPTPTTLAGKTYYIKHITNSGTIVTIDTEDAATIDGSASITMTAQWTSKTVQTDGTNWFII